MGETKYIKTIVKDRKRVEQIYQIISIQNHEPN